MEPRRLELLTPCSHCSGSLNSNQLPQVDFYTSVPTNVRQSVFSRYAKFKVFSSRCSICSVEVELLLVWGIPRP